MTKQVRDWQKDMDTIKRQKRTSNEMTERNSLNIADHWLQQYAAEKERADKQQTAIKESLDTWESLDDFDDPLDAVEKMITILQPFYQEKEEEAK